ncbi:MAG: hypothetical protein H0U23_03145 [Blastocatellia bacterium]|nr:hypothetical protein [Blastocatellia bacterium]
MRLFAAALLAFNVLHLWFAFPIDDVLAGRPIYLFTIPHIGLLALVLVLLATIAIRAEFSALIAMTTAAGLALTVATASYAMSQWPGGDDGGGLGWFFFVGGFSLLNAGAAVVLTVVLVMRLRNRTQRSLH